MSTAAWPAHQGIALGALSGPGGADQWPVAYSQAPPAMKGTLMSFWNLSVTIGNLWVLIVNAAVKNGTVTNAIKSSGFGVTAFQMFFFAAFAFCAAFAFGLCARRHQLVDYYRKA